MASSRKILLTTSRNPSPKIRTFCNDLARVLAGVVRVNRGKMSIDKLTEKALEQDAEKVVVVDRWQGGLGAIRFFRVEESCLTLVPPVIHVSGIRLSRELGGVRLKYAVSLIVPPPETSLEASRLAEVLSEFFNLPARSMGKPFEAGQTIMTVSRDRAGRIVVTFVSGRERVEIGPRINISSMEW